jgi:membrane protease YdiL (CAAX protease family)
LDASRPSQPTPSRDPEPIPTGAPSVAAFGAVAEGADTSASPIDAVRPGRTRPTFEQLAPGPPTWPGWVAIPIGFLAAIAGDAVAQFLLSQHANADSPAIGLWVGFIGALVLVAGLAWLAVASIIRRRALPANRYRGPSVLVLFAMIELGLPLLLVPPLLAVTGGDFSALASPAALTVQLLLTPLIFIGLLVLFVGLPRALEGVRVWLGAASVRQALIGLLAGVFIWTAAQVLAGVLSILLRLIGINPEGQQEVTSIARQLPVPIAVVTIAILAPIAEEIFFRGFVFNAWEREYGTRRALIGAALLFGLAHVPGGTALAVVIVLLLGLVLTAVYARTRNLATTIGIHAAFNLASVLALFYLPGLR